MVMTGTGLDNSTLDYFDFSTFLESSSSIGIKPDFRRSLDIRFSSGLFG